MPVTVAFHNRLSHCLPEKLQELDYVQAPCSFPCFVYDLEKTCSLCFSASLLFPLLWFKGWMLLYGRGQVGTAPCSKEKVSVQNELSVSVPWNNAVFWAELWSNWHFCAFQTALLLKPFLVFILFCRDRSCSAHLDIPAVCIALFSSDTSRNPERFLSSLLKRSWKTAEKQLSGLHHCSSNVLLHLIR